MLNSHQYAPVQKVLMKPKTTILVVDDEEPILRSLARVFRKEQYRIVVESTPEKGLAVVKKEHIEVVISDYRMPQMTGLDLTISLWETTRKMEFRSYKSRQKGRRNRRSCLKRYVF